jgi:hypothetical protein
LFQREGTLWQARPTNFKGRRAAEDEAALEGRNVDTSVEIPTLTMELLCEAFSTNALADLVETSDFGNLAPVSNSQLTVVSIIGNANVSLCPFNYIIFPAFAGCDRKDDQTFREAPD